MARSVGTYLGQCVENIARVNKKLGFRTSLYGIWSVHNFHYSKPKVKKEKPTVLPTCMQLQVLELEMHLPPTSNLSPYELMQETQTVDPYLYHPDAVTASCLAPEPQKSIRPLGNATKLSRTNSLRTVDQYGRAGSSGRPSIYSPLSCRSILPSFLPLLPLPLIENSRCHFDLPQIPSFFEAASLNTVTKGWVLSTTLDELLPQKNTPPPLPFTDSIFLDLETS